MRPLAVDCLNTRPPHISKLTRYPSGVRQKPHPLDRTYFAIATHPCAKLVAEHARENRGAIPSTQLDVSFNLQERTACFQFQRCVSNRFRLHSYGTTLQHEASCRLRARPKTKPIEIALLLCFSLGRAAHQAFTDLACRENRPSTEPRLPSEHHRQDSHGLSAMVTRTTRQV